MNFREYIKTRLPEDRIAAVDAEVLTAVAEMKLPEIRKAHQYTQAQMAETLNVGQATIAKMEHRTDTYISTLRRYIEAMGGELHIVADFNGTAVEISNFKDIDPPRHVAALHAKKDEDTKTSVPT